MKLHSLNADIDECSGGTDNCAVDATCMDTDGSYTCTCNTGYSGDGITCTSKTIDLELHSVHIITRRNSIYNDCLVSTVHILVHWYNESFLKIEK